MVGECGPDGAEVASEADACVEGIEQGEDARAGGEGVGVLRDEAGEGDEDAMNFCLFFFEEADEFVVVFDGF